MNSDDHETILYCICQTPYDRQDYVNCVIIIIIFIRDKPMILCNYCAQYYHISCVCKDDKITHQLFMCRFCNEEGYDQPLYNNGKMKIRNVTPKTCADDLWSTITLGTEIEDREASVYVKKVIHLFKILKW